MDNFSQILAPDEASLHQKLAILWVIQVLKSKKPFLVWTIDRDIHHYIAISLQVIFSALMKQLIHITGIPLHIHIYLLCTLREIGACACFICGDSVCCSKVQHPRNLMKKRVR